VQADSTFPLDSVEPADSNGAVLKMTSGET